MGSGAIHFDYAYLLRSCLLQHPVEESHELCPLLFFKLVTDFLNHYLNSLDTEFRELLILILDAVFEEFKEIRKQIAHLRIVAAKQVCNVSKALLARILEPRVLFGGALIGVQAAQLLKSILDLVKERA